MGEEVKTVQEDKPTVITVIIDTQKAIQKELSVINSDMATIKEGLKSISDVIAEVKSNIVPLKEKKDAGEQLLKEIKLLDGTIQESLNAFSELNSLMASMSGNVKSLPAIQAQIENSNALVSKIPEKYDKLVARIEKITDVMGMPEKRSWLRSAVQLGINLGVVVVIILAAIGLYRVWLLIWPIFSN